MTIWPLLYKINAAILNPVIGLMFAIAFAYFFFGIFQFIGKTGSDEGREKGKKNIMYGVIGLFIMVAVYGIINLVLGTFGIPVPPNSGI